MRDILPKGQSFDQLGQNALNLIFSHINSIKRKVLSGKTPYELFAFMMGEQLPALLGITHFPANDVIQSPKLLKR